MPYLHLIDEEIGLIDNEIRIVEWRIKYPEQFKQQLDKPSLSPLYLADRTTLINIITFTVVAMVYTTCLNPCKPQPY